MTFVHGFQNFMAMETVLIEHGFDSNKERTLISESGRYNEISSLHETELINTMMQMLRRIYAMLEV